MAGQGAGWEEEMDIDVKPSSSPKLIESSNISFVMD